MVNYYILIMNIITFQDQTEADRSEPRVAEKTLSKSKRWEQKIEEGIAGTTCT